jgi:hypothetical protein
MFIEHKQLKVLNVPSTRVARINSSGGNIQMAFTGYPPQMCSAYLVLLSSGTKVLVVVAFYLSDSDQSIFFVPKNGEVPVEEAEDTFEEGFVFAESMGFVLNETDYHLLSSDDQQKLWASLPISKAPTSSVNEPATEMETADKADDAQETLDAYRERSLKSLGRFLSSM